MTADAGGGVCAAGLHAGAHGAAVHRVRAGAGRRGGGVGLRGADAVAHDVLASCCATTPSPNGLTASMENNATGCRTPTPAPALGRDHGLPAAPGRLVPCADARWLVAAGVIGSCWSRGGHRLVYPIMRRAVAAGGPGRDPGQINAPDGATLDYTNRYARELERIGEGTRSSTASSPTSGNPTVSQGNVVYRAVDWEERKRTTLEMAREMTPAWPRCRGECLPDHAALAGPGLSQRPVNFVIRPPTATRT
jgi:hypothetical protein